MPRSGEEGKNKEKGKNSKYKKKAVILIVVSLVIVNLFGVWYIFFCPWTIRDVALAATGEDENIIWGDNSVRNPGFSHDLAGKDKIVRGRVTNIVTYMTTLGPLTYIELDDYEKIRIIEWNSSNYEIGQVIEKRIHFEWGKWNEYKNVYSPQLDFPILSGAPVIERIINGVSCAQGLILLANQTSPNDPINISVFVSRGEGFPLKFFNCSIKTNEYSWFSDYMNAVSNYEDGSVIDMIPSLTNNFGQNEIIHFSDANQNGLLDDGDYFRFNLTMPEEDCAILTYIFSINGGYESSYEKILSGICYIVMTNRGVLRYTSCISNKEEIPPYVVLKIISENETSEGISTTLNISNVIGDTLVISDSYYHMSGPRYSIDNRVLTYPTFFEDGWGIEFSDKNGNGLLDKDDIFIILRLENLTEYYFSLALRTSATYLHVTDIQWRPGIGAYTGRLPVIEFGEPYVVGPPENKTYVIDIERMYGIPGLNLSNEDPGEWYRVKIEKDGQEIFPPADLTINFEKNVGEINITFVDEDDNGFINTGDYFTCAGGNPGEFSLTLDYVERDNRYNEGFMVRFSQSISWIV